MTLATIGARHVRLLKTFDVGTVPVSAFEVPCNTLFMPRGTAPPHPAATPTRTTPSQGPAAASAPCSNRQPSTDSYFAPPAAYGQQRLALGRALAALTASPMPPDSSVCLVPLECTDNVCKINIKVGDGWLYALEVVPLAQHVLVQGKVPLPPSASLAASHHRLPRR
ncbi:hypothetical protein TSOC_000909 [Tetrabaena socialis]|uniref:Uncharacterized protein n=1 Tax=Tetrabaena socialis TaxID=47790 RepID=A0A2J8AI52_9CHLO|nr:hypothetical protein TSOC_000909 [Tetrabaena socialis]|eukprot:PNH12198.1 hypothetical protein TSOC_000909 [Tetrabaena socialis]